jgi:hypothetical protein
MMDEEEKAGGSSAEGEEIDFELAMEAAREVSEEFFRKLGGVYVEEVGEFIIDDPLMEEEWEQRIEEALKEMNVRVNEVYRQKKQERSQ